ncbi:hypothetical protein JZ751_005136 [Albula glossodonta]|uniref:Uncharacterized protein n=1 Tax=Albula glossodonta TaxID=121402 RepID=A0A8T2PFL1_9TELE|nr:hypothetical protein JZ751_005136 [Albula glossodonta]
MSQGEESERRSPPPNDKRLPGCQVEGGWVGETFPCPHFDCSRYFLTSLLRPAPPPRPPSSTPQPPPSAAVLNGARSMLLPDSLMYPTRSLLLGLREVRQERCLRKSQVEQHEHLSAGTYKRAAVWLVWHAPPMQFFLNNKRYIYPLLQLAVSLVTACYNCSLELQR